ncbi:hypothetical protein NQ317_002869 [Molorchus minor]|uniref:Uncharacterized protein n=1 Tax=Molorchus minor TaxID=1323400 RepID=A0ABQ9J2B7_9CUCU|nr:hypothetical protein NQ317_002869 [Molorchus minor]
MSRQLYIKQNFSSALYVTGDKAHQTFVILTPVIDFEKQLENKEILLKNIAARKLSIDLQQIESDGNFFRIKKILEFTRIEIGRLISDLMQDAETNGKQIEGLKLHSKLVKDDLKNIKEHLYGLEEDTMLQILNLPNILHEKTHSEAVTIYDNYFDNPKETSDCHMVIGSQNGYIEYVDPLTCYFKSDAALFEMGILNYFRHQRTSNSFLIQIFVEALLSRGVETTINYLQKVFTLEELEESKAKFNRLHLCGSATIHSFMAYFTQLIRHPEKDLFNLSQESAISVFVSTLEEDDYLEEITKLVITCYKPLGYNFRLTLLPKRVREV